MVDGANIRLIDSHTECDGGHNDIGFAGHESFLDTVPGVVPEAGMVSAGIQPL